jgi:glycerol kinase
VARAALEAIAWRVADVVSVVRETVPVEVLRVDGGLTRDPTLLQLQADAAGVAVQLGAVDATAAGAAALAAVGAGIWGSTLEIAERVPTGPRVEPTREPAWRKRAHAEWREFVERAVAL